MSRYEQPERQEICLNGSWKFQGTSDISVPGTQRPEVGNWDAAAIKIPSPWNVNAFSMTDKVQGGDFRAYPSYPKNWESFPAAWMEKTVSIPKEWSGKRLVLHFGAVAGRMVVYFNGKWAGEGFNIFFPQDFDVTPLVQLGGDNQILVKIISSKVMDKSGSYGRREYLSGSFWGTHISGIWQDVFLLAEPAVAVSQVFVQPCVDQDELRVQVTVANHSSNSSVVDLSGNVHNWINLAGQSVEEAPEIKWKLGSKAALKLPARQITLAAGQSQTITLTNKVEGLLKLWSPETPNLCGLVLQLSANGKAVDAKYQRFGWRQFALKGNQLLLNGRPIVLKGDSWHFMGVPQMSRRYAYAWYRLLKDAGANAVRLHASVYPSFYHDMADEMGMMILDESAIWLSDGGPKADSDLFWSNCRSHVEELVLRDRNHPSVFGWSVVNEILPVLRNVWHCPQSMVDHCVSEISVWADICRQNDPTRDWISGDGEWDAEGRLPTINIHYGDDGGLKNASESGKPWAVGETSMAYYGTPKQVSKFNGERAYESVLGRMEGLAYECYGLLRSQQKFGGSYQSVFNIVWYAVKPLPLGKRNLTQESTPEEGVFFGPYLEGVPGMQPERLGPYVSTLNPGYDKTLPLYQPWPMFNAIRDANTGKTNSQWAKLPTHASQNVSLSSSNIKNTLLYLPSNGKQLVNQLSKVGINAAGFVGGAANPLLLLSGSDVASLDTSASNAVTSVLSAGGTVWIWDITKEGAKAVSAVLGAQVRAEPRQASSFVVKGENSLLAGLHTTELYFAESDDWLQMTHGLGGSFVEGSEVVLEACAADWRTWNYQGEPVKTAALLRSELEHTGFLPAIVIRNYKGGRVILCNFSPAIASTKKLEVVERMMRNEGVDVKRMAEGGGFLDMNGCLEKALVCGGFAVDDMKNAYGDKFDLGEIKEGAAFNGSKWTLCKAADHQIFDFRSYPMGGSQENTVAYLALWIKSSKPLNDLLSEPDLPKLSLTYGCDDGCQIWLNGQRLANNERTGPMEPEMFSVNPLLLHLGWNQLVIKVVQGSGEWKFAGKFDCTDRSFLQKLEFATAKPEAN